MEPEKKLTIQLSGLRFFGHYGLYPVELKWTSELIIDLSIQFKLTISENIGLKDTIDYTDIYNTIAQEMHKDHLLLECIASNLINSLKKMDERITFCKIRVSKKPQLAGPLDNISIEMEY